VTQADRDYWLDRFTVDEIRELAAGMLWLSEAQALTESGTRRGTRLTSPHLTG
jgi:hypothetical protein